MVSYVASAFKNIRDIKGLTQEELAEALGVTAGHVGMIEQGRAKPSYEVMDKLVNEYGVDANLFFRSEVLDDKTVGVAFINSIRSMSPQFKGFIKLYSQHMDQLSIELRELEGISDE